MKSSRFIPSYFQAGLMFILGAGMPVLGAIGVLVERGDSSEGSDFDPSISATDLINSGTSTFSSVSSTPLTGFVGNANNGSSLALGVRDAELNGGVSEFPATIDFNLDVSVNTLGYQLSSISTFTGLGYTNDPEWFERYHEFAHQSYTVAYSQIGDAGFTDFVTVGEASVPGEYTMKVSLIGLSSDVPSGVDAIRFTWYDPIPTIAASPEPGRTLIGIREIDVFGSPVTIPEPSSVAMLSLAICSVWRRKRDATAGC